MSVVTRYIEVHTKGGTDVIDLTRGIKTELKTTRLNQGTVTVFVSGSTAGLTTVEYEPGLIKDLKHFFEKIAPENERYAHEETWHDGNGHSHIRASFLGPSITLPFIDRKSVV